MKLREVIKAILDTGLTQPQLGARLGRAQGKISDLLKENPTLEKCWQLSLRLLPLCNEFGIDPYRESTTEQNRPAQKLENGLAEDFLRRAVEQEKTPKTPRHAKKDDAGRAPKTKKRGRPHAQ